MANNKLFKNLITATAIVASMATTVGAGIKVMASRNNQEIEVPEVVNPSPEASSEPASTQNVGSTPIPTTLPTNSVIVEETPSPIVAGEVVASPSDFPVASMIPRGKFDDDEDDENEDEDELDREDHEKEDDEDKDTEDN